MDDIMMYMMGIAAAALGIIVFVYLRIAKKSQNSDYKKMQQLRKGTQKKTYSSEVLYQKLYVRYVSIPIFKRYILKLRRRLEIINIGDEYNTRKDAARIITKTLAIVVPLLLATILITSTNYLVMFILVIFELFMIDSMVEGSVDNLDNKLLRQQLDFFSEIRHAYHEFNMVEEAIYQVSQDDEKEISRQGDKIYEILIADDPETELEKYYDIAPNSFLKEFAGVSYLTKEFGDRKVDGASLYLKNINNIAQEMQLEILKRDKLNYVFQSLSFIAIAPVLFLEPIKAWSITNFPFTASWYEGREGMIVQILILVLTILSYILVRSIKDNGSVSLDTRSLENPWQNKIYKKPIAKKIVDMFMPKERTKEHKKLTQLLKDSASPLKMEWLFVNRIVFSIITFFVSLVLIFFLHMLTINYVYEEPTTDYNLLGELSGSDLRKAEELTESDNEFLDRFKGLTNTEKEDIKDAVERSDYYETADLEEINTATDRIYEKLQIVNSEHMKWFEFLIAFVFSIIAYMAPIWILMFQVRIRQLEMEDEVMQFQTIILMLMRIERVNVEIILEWLERYSNIFRAPISKCVNNYESGSWEALEEMRNEISYMPLIRIVESLQAAVEKIPIKDAFDELDSERDYYREKRKESNARLIQRKGMIGKVLGFAPMVCMFVGYLIVPLVFIGLTSMSSSFSAMG